MVQFTNQAFQGSCDQIVGILLVINSKGSIAYVLMHVVLLNYKQDSFSFLLLPALHLNQSISLFFANLHFDIVFCSSEM
jgi:hypothetical protein